MYFKIKFRHESMLDVLSIFKQYLMKSQSKGGLMAMVKEKVKEYNQYVSKKILEQCQLNEEVSRLSERMGGVQKYTSEDYLDMMRQGKERAKLDSQWQANLGCNLDQLENTFRIGSSAISQGSAKPK